MRECIKQLPNFRARLNANTNDDVQGLASSASDQVGLTSDQCRMHAEILLQRGELAGALNLAQKAVEKDKNSAAAWDTLGSVLVEQSALKEAYLCYTNALKLDKDFSSAANNIGATLGRLAGSMKRRCIIERCIQNLLQI